MKAKVALEDRVEIEELMARYAWALDTGDFDRPSGTTSRPIWTIK